MNYNKHDRTSSKITSKERLRILPANSIEHYAEAHLDKYNSKKEFMCAIYDELGTDEAEMKALDIDLSSI